MYATMTAESNFVRLTESNFLRQLGNSTPTDRNPYLASWMFEPKHFNVYSNAFVTGADVSCCAASDTQRDTLMMKAHALRTTKAVAISLTKPDGEVFELRLLDRERVRTVKVEVSKLSGISAALQELYTMDAEEALGGVALLDNFGATFKTRVLKSFCQSWEISMWK